MRPDEKKEFYEEVKREEQLLKEKAEKHPKVEGDLVIGTDPRTGLPMARKDRPGLEWPDH